MSTLDPLIQFFAEMDMFIARNDLHNKPPANRAKKVVESSK